MTAGTPQGEAGGDAGTVSPHFAWWRRGAAQGPDEASGESDGAIGASPHDDNRAVACIASTSPARDHGTGGAYWLDMAGADLSLLNTGRAPVLLDHARHTESLVGVVERAWIEGESCLAVLRFATTGRARDALELVRCGVLANVSVGMRLRLPAEPDASGARRAEYWRPFEVSLVVLPNDWTASLDFPVPARVRDLWRARIAADAGGNRATWQAWPARAGAGLAAALGCAPEAAEAALRAEVVRELARLGDAAAAAV